MQEDYFDPIYKGCTAPSAVWGVPLLPFIYGALTIAQLALINFFFVRLSASVFFVVIGVFAFAWARKLGKNDEHRLLQYVMKLRMRWRQQAVRRFWGAVSFSPLPYRK